MSPKPLLLSRVVLALLPSSSLSTFTDVFISSVPEFDDTSYKFPPNAVNPSGFLKDAVAICPRAVLLEFARIAVITPSLPILNEDIFCQLSAVGGLALVSPGTKTESGILNGCKELLDAFKTPSESTYTQSPTLTGSLSAVAIELVSLPFSELTSLRRYPITLYPSDVTKLP